MSRTAILTCLLCVAVVCLTRAAHADGMSIAVVDLQGAVWQTEDGIRAQVQLKKLADKRQTTVDGKQKELKRMQVDIELQARFLSRQAVTRRMEIWQSEMVQLQTVFVDFNKELDKKQSEFTAPILTRLIALITKLAQKNGYDLVIDRRAAPYARTDLDLTDRVVAMYNAGESG